MVAFLEEFCQRMPKCEFNARWEACISKQLLQLIEHRQIEQKNSNSPVYKEIHRKSLLWAYGQPRRMKDVTSLLKWLSRIDLENDEIRQITEDIIERFHADNVVYLELRMKPRSGRYMSIDSSILSVIEAIATKKAVYPDMVVKLLLTIDWKQPMVDASATIHFAIRNRLIMAIPGDVESRILRGIEVIGNPRGNPLKFYSLLASAKRHGLIVVYNLSKVNGLLPRHERRLRNLTNRFSNASILHNPPLQGEGTKIPVEVSFKTEQMKRLQNEGGRRYYVNLYEAGHPILLSATYNELMSCTLSDVYYQFASQLNLNRQQIYDLARMASFYVPEQLVDGIPRIIPFNKQYEEFARFYELDNTDDHLNDLFLQCFSIGLQSDSSDDAMLDNAA